MIDDIESTSSIDVCNKDSIVVCTLMANSVNTDTLSLRT